MTHYQTLGVAETATADEIKKAYRKLASKHHPDKGGEHTKFQEIQAAYDILSDNQKRQQYDMERKGMGGNPGFQFHWNSHGPGDINEIFRQFGFGGDPFGQFHQHHAQPRRNKDLRIDIPITLADTLQEQIKNISVQTTNGERSALEVRIPRGVTNGTNIKYAGLGDNLFNTIPRGDLYVQITVLPTRDFMPNGLDLHTKVSVNCLLAVTGGEIQVFGIDEKQFIINMPAGTQPGTKFRIPQQGLYQLHSENRGDLYIELELIVPQNLTTDQIEIVRSLI